MSENILTQYIRLLTQAEAARAVSDFEDYRKLRDQAYLLRLSVSLGLY